MSFLRALSVVTLAAVLSACAQTPFAAPSRPAGAVAVRHQADTRATVLRPESVPQGLLSALMPIAQKQADDASRKRQIDFFNLHAAPVGLKLEAGGETAHVLSLLGTSKERTDLNIEMRLVEAGGKVAMTHNYSGPVTTAAEVQSQAAALKASRKTGLAFELIFGVPGGGVADEYVDYMSHLETYLVQRYGARPFTFDDGPMIFALNRGAETLGFVFTNQGNRLVLGDRKYADVQSVVALSAEAELLGAYMLIGFNEKTESPESAPKYRFEDDKRFGTLVQFGEL